MKSKFKNILVLISIIAQGLEIFSADAPQPVTLKTYGYVKLDAAYDSNRTTAGDLSFYTLPEVAGEKDNELSFTAKESRIGLELSGPDFPGIKTTGKFESDFYGGGTSNAPNPRLRLAYLDLGFENGFSIRSGQDWDLFNVVLPKTLDAAVLGDAGYLYSRRPQIRIGQDVKIGDSKLLSRLAITRTIGQDVDAGGVDDGSDEGTPTVETNLGFEIPLLTTKASKINIGGHFGTETLDTVTTTNGVSKITGNDTTDYDSWSVVTSFFIPFSNYFALQGGGFAGENLDAYFGGIGQGINKKLEKEISAKGGWIEGVVDITSDLNVNAGYGIDKPDNEDLNKNDRSKNTRLFTNAFYKITSVVTTGFEYSHIATSYKEASKSTDDRFQVSTIYRF